MRNKESLDGEVVEAIRAGQKVTAIKLLREKEGMGLKEAKDRVDLYCQQHKEELPQGDSNFGLLLVVVLVLAAIGFFLFL